MAVPTIDDLPPAPAGKRGWPWTEDGGKRGKMNLALPEGGWPRISIVTPNYNYAHFIEETIRSVLLQGYPNLEYIVIDDGSKDESAEVIRRYEPWLAYWTSRPNRGQSCSINEGFRQAGGAIWGWLNSDDVYYPGALAAVAQRLAGKERAMLVGAATLTNGPEQLVGRDDRRQPAWPEMAYDGRTFPQPSTFWTADLWALAGPLDETLRYVMDFELWLRMRPQAQAVLFSEQLLAFERIHENQMSLAAVRQGQISPVNKEKAYAILQGARRRGESPFAWFLRSYGRRFQAAVRRRRLSILWGAGLHSVVFKAAFAKDYRTWP